jgi:hypothetical protein
VNTYTGTTTVVAGTLALASGSTASPITVNSVASLGFTLGSSVTSSSTVTFDGGSSVKITGTPVAATSYTLLTTTATITGTPVLNPAIPGFQLQVENGNTLKLIPAGGSGYAAWIDGFYPGVVNPLIVGVDADPDGDGVKNGIENFFGTNPTSFSGGVVEGAVTSNTFTFTHPQNSTPASDLTAAYRWSKDLTAFSASGATDGAGTTVTFTRQLNTPVNGTTTVTATVTGTATTRVFVQVKVTRN